MEPRIKQACQDLSESLPLEDNIDAIELTDKDLEKVTGAWGRFSHFSSFGGSFGHFGGFGLFHSSTAIAINNVAIAGNRSIALSTLAFAG